VSLEQTVESTIGVTRYREMPSPAGDMGRGRCDVRSSVGST
jgi:hypothetical protein